MTINGVHLTAKELAKGLLEGLVLVALVIGCYWVIVLRVWNIEDNKIKAEAEPVQEVSEQAFDVHYLANWCGQREGSIYMVGAHEYESYDNVKVLEDETGNLWEIEDVFITPTDFLLLWIDDNNTTDKTDDVIVKIWKEVNP